MDRRFAMRAKVQAAGRRKAVSWLGGRSPRPARDAGAEFDELTIALAQGVPRRELLRRFGVALASAILASLGMRKTWSEQVSCPNLCGQFPNQKQQDRCLFGCFDCLQMGHSVCGVSHSGTVICVDVQTDVQNCGGCGKRCRGDQACCHGLCTAILDDAQNCGACDNACAKEQQCLQGRCRPIPQGEPTPCGDVLCPPSQPVCCPDTSTKCYEGGTTCCEGYACPPGYTCSGTSDRCCPKDTPFFDASTGFCFECLESDDCGAGKQCCGKRCVTGDGPCCGTTICPEGFPICCDPEESKCCADPNCGTCTTRGHTIRIGTPIKAI